MTTTRRWASRNTGALTKRKRADTTGRGWPGERLENGQYAPIPIDELDVDVLQGYSPILNLRLRWERGRLGWHDPATGRHILTYEDQRDRADHAEDRVRALEAELNRLRNS